MGGSVDHAPSAQFASEQNVCNTVNPPDVVILKRTPESFGPPPPKVVPYKLPSLACMIPTGWVPSTHGVALQKMCRVVIWPASVILYTVPQPPKPFVAEPPSAVTP